MVFFICLFLLAGLVICMGFNWEMLPRAYLLEDWSHSEVFQYKYIAGLAILTQLAFTRSRRYAAWTPVFFYLLLDDALQFHERMGGPLADSTNMPSVLGLRPKDLAEGLFTVVIAVVIVVLLAIGYLGADHLIKQHFRHLAFFVDVLGFFGVVIDVVHQMIPKPELVHVRP